MVRIPQRKYKFIVFDETSGLLLVLVQDLLLRIRHLRDLDDICHNIEQLVFLVAKITNGQGFSSVVLGRWTARWWCELLWAAQCPSLKSHQWC